MVLLNRFHLNSHQHVITCCFCYVFFSGLPYALLSYDPYGPASTFFAKPLMEVPYESRTHLRERARKKPYDPTTRSVRPRVLKLQANLSPNWSYDKILID